MRVFLTAIVVVTTMISCSNQKSTAKTPSEHEKIVRQYFGYFNKHEWENMANMYTEVADFKDPSLGQGIVKQTRKQIIEKYSGLSGMFPDVKDEIAQIYPSGEKHIIVEFISTGTAPDGSTFKLPICAIFTIENGKISKDYTYYDNFEDPGHE
ncbi:MAG TPA: nuclear transport factor 2 family protein [Sediminibacterium sp.]|nr:nuclear transport factor 2 family protein [Sediminibacterium sp.]